MLSRPSLSHSSGLTEALHPPAQSNSNFWWAVLNIFHIMAQIKDNSIWMIPWSKEKQLPHPESPESNRAWALVDPGLEGSTLCATLILSVVHYSGTWLRCMPYVLGFLSWSLAGSWPTLRLCSCLDQPCCYCDRLQNSWLFLGSCRQPVWVSATFGIYTSERISQYNFQGAHRIVPYSKIASFSTSKRKGQM